MEVAVTTVLTGLGFDTVYSVGRVWKLTIFVRFQTEPEDRFSGRRWSPQTPESLAAAGDIFSQLHKCHQ
ncbi:hypothetical protein [Levilactobacillus enshiensis]|uniref:hypothetical protein n=1 Tax=Levilactobacillus enshiensis TaxID=2590213 RepID=UPI00117A1C47|nr:hypothetical protein [Levilactobacillus enshiensis]